MGRTAGIVMTGLLIAAGAAGAMAAVGDGPGRAGGKGMREGGAGFGLKRLDGDNDLAVTIEEFLKRRTEAFAKRDKNADGSLDAAELSEAPQGRRLARQERRMETLLKRLDEGKDGKLTRAEFERDPRLAAGGARKPASARVIERQKRLFAFYDRNADGTLETSEYEAGRAEEQDFNRRRTMHALDRSGDGKVTLEEYTADARFRFLRLDLDRDGRITAADLPPIERQRWTSR